MKHLLPALLTILVIASVRTLSQNAPTAPVATPAATARPAGSAVSIRNVGPVEFDTLRSATNTVLLDVRTPAEYADGHLPGAKLVDFKAADFTQQVGKLDKSKTYLVHCAGGFRSAKACTKMVNLGFTNLINLEGGLSAWQEAGKPVEK